jgi:hypothetical protein
MQKDVQVTVVGKVFKPNRQKILASGTLEEKYDFSSSNIDK